MSRTTVAALATRVADLEAALARFEVLLAEANAAPKKQPYSDGYKPIFVLLSPEIRHAQEAARDIARRNPNYSIKLGALGERQAVLAKRRAS